MRPLTSPEPVSLLVVERDFLDDFAGRRPAGAADRALRFLAPPQGSLEHRWSVYAAGYVSRLVEALENDYPALRRILGEGPFGSLVGRYVAVCPPRSFDIGRAGDRLTVFLEGDPLTADMPFLPDLARLEWTLAEAFVAEDAEPLRWEDLAGVDPGGLVGLPLRLVPGTAVVRSRWPLHALWRSKDQPDHAVSVQLEAPPTRTLVWRSGLQLRCRIADEVEARLVELGIEGRNLSELEATEVEAAGADAWVARFRGLVMEGLFRAFGEPAQPATT